MSRQKGWMPQWAVEEALKFERLRGEPLINAMWGLADRLDRANEIEARFEMMRRILDAAGKFGRLDHTLRAFTEMRRIYQRDSRYAHFRDSVLWYYKWLVDAL